MQRWTAILSCVSLRRQQLTKKAYFRLAKMKVKPNSIVARRRDTVNRSRVIVTEPESPDPTMML